MSGVSVNRYRLDTGAGRFDCDVRFCVRRTYPNNVEDIGEADLPPLIEACVEMGGAELATPCSNTSEAWRLIDGDPETYWAIGERALRNPVACGCE